jgi:hypothetical protein
MNYQCGDPTLDAVDTLLGEDSVDTLVLDHLEVTTLKLVDMKVTHQALYAMLPNLKFLSLVGCETR